jgi:hypothetical protein
MQPIGAGRFDRGDLVPQPAEIGGEKTRGDGNVPGLGISHGMFLATVADVTQGSNVVRAVGWGLV